jgi:hypothetical protein
MEFNPLDDSLVQYATQNEKNLSLAIATADARNKIVLKVVDGFIAQIQKTFVNDDLEVITDINIDMYKNSKTKIRRPYSEAKTLLHGMQQTDRVRQIMVLG